MPMSNASGLVDTNILVYATDSASEYHRKARAFLEKNIPRGNLILSLQNLTEFYSLITNPKIFVDTFTSKEAREEIKKIILGKHYQLILPLKETPFTVLKLLSRYKAKGREIHDILLAAVMIDNKINTIYTADTKIFSKLDLKAINPLA